MIAVATIALLAAGLLLATVAGQIWIVHTLRPAGRFVPTGAGRLHVVALDADGERAGAPPLVLLHGASGNLQDMQLALGARLAGRWRVLLIDRPGHGFSARGGANAASPSRQAEILHEALQALGAERAILVAHSWSGALATAYAIDYPQRVCGLVLIAPATHPWPGGVAWYYRAATMPLLGPLFAWFCALPFGSLMLGRAVRAVFAPQPPPPDYVRRAAIALALRPKTFIANAQDVARLKVNLMRQAARYREIAAPVAIVCGDCDDTVSTDVHARMLAAEIPHAELHVVPGVGHMPHHACAGQVIAAIESVARAAGRVTRT